MGVGRPIESAQFGDPHARERFDGQDRYQARRGVVQDRRHLLGREDRVVVRDVLDQPHRIRRRLI